jgi:transcriptional antiterminator NusG
MAWYILQTNPNYEAKVIEGIEKRKVEGKLLGIQEVFAPEDLITEYKDGKKKERKKKRFSNYLYVEMEYSDSIWHELKGIRGVVGFLGITKNRPSEVPLAEIEKMKKEISGEIPKPKVIFEIGSNVRITSGSFADFIGIVKSVDYEKNKAVIELRIFGRETPVDMPLNEIENATA